MWQTQDAVDVLVRPTWGGAKHGYDRLLYGVVMNTMALGDRLSFYLAPTQPQTDRLRALLRDIGADAEAAAVAVQMWRHTLIHTGDPMPFINTATGTTYRWLLHWGEEHLPRDKHLTFANASGTRVLAFGALYAVADLRQAADELLTAADHDDELASRLVATREQLVTKQSKALDF